MNDDQLRSELERRADSATPRSDWPKRVLLPAVWHEFDARPQPVITSRLSPKWSVAALVVGLLVLVLAVPRIAPLLSPAGSPFGPEPQVMSTRDFVAALESSQLADQTVLVDGAIVAMEGEPPPPGPGCGSGGPSCLLGRLDYELREVRVYTPVSGAAVAPSRPAGPTRGTLLLSVDADRNVAFDGLVKPGQDGLYWSVGAAQGIDIGAVPSSEVVLVRGWLGHTQTLGGVTCVSRLVPTNTPNLDALPNASCSRSDYLSGSVPSNKDLVGPYLTVQDGAAAEFSPADPSQEGLYAISPRPYGRGCQETPPCWFWDVIARVNSSATQSPQPSATQPFAEGPFPLPTGQTGPLPSGIPTACAGIGLDAVLHGDPADPRRVWLMMADGGRKEVVWPTGYQVAFTPTAVVLDARGNVVLTEGSRIEGACVTADPNVLELAPPFEIVTATPTRSPEPTPSPSLAVSRTMDCGLAGSLPITFIDHSGLVDSCSIETPPTYGADVTVTRALVGAQTHLIVVWPPNLCSSVGTDVEFWGPLARSQDVAPSQPHYVLQVGQLPSNGGPCGGGWGDPPGGGVDLVLSADVLPSEVTAYLTNTGGGSSRTTASAQAASGRFVLQLFGNSDGWSVGEPITASALVVYVGGHDQVTAVGLVQPVFGVEQLDGSLDIPPPPMTLQCPADHPVIFEPDVEQNSDLYLPGFDGPVVLPAGTYRLYAVVDFFVGDACQGTPVRLTASIVITVH